ncbi:DUF3265 domain-containing protein [Vibrio crassostreae]|nr:DUF3265 domain-containing protein [Vibrio crassostreae]
MSILSGEDHSQRVAFLPCFDFSAYGGVQKHCIALTTT